jgi:hypothetical protein
MNAQKYSLHYYSFGREHYWVYFSSLCILIDF